MAASVGHKSGSGYLASSITLVFAVGPMVQLEINGHAVERANTTGQLGQGQMPSWYTRFCRLP